MRCPILPICLLAVPALAQPSCVNFPANFVPFSSISYVTAASGAGDHLVVGVPAPGLQAAIAANLPVPAFNNQAFCDVQVQLASQQYYSNVYVPTAAELTGNFPAFAGLLVNPATNQPYSGGVIPATQLNTVFALRIGPAHASSSTQNWRPTGSTRYAEAEGAALLLPNGKVLVMDGNNGPVAELYDPVTGTFSPAGPPKATHGALSALTVLNDGRVLVTGGTANPSAAEFYDPATNQFTLIKPMTQPHGAEHRSTLLPDGRVLITGGAAQAGFFGHGNTIPNAGADIFDPGTGTFTSAGPMTVNRAVHTATALPDGRVLITGGVTQTSLATTVYDSAEVFDPVSGNFAPVLSMQQTRAYHFAVLLPNGLVLVGAGYGSSSQPAAELFDPVKNHFVPTGSMSAQRITNDQGAVLLSSGQVLVAGGESTTPAGLSSTELYNPATGQFTLAGNLVTARTRHTTTLLTDGRVLVAGGYPSCCNGSGMASAEIYTPQTQGLVTSQSGLTFRVAQGNTTAPSQNVIVLSAADTIPWTLSTKTFQGGGWLTATASGNVSDPAKAAVSIAINANPAGLAAQDYYGSVTLTPSDGKHPPVTIAIVLSIVPAGASAPPSVLPSGLVFLTPLNTAGTPQSFVISNLTSKQLAFAGTAAGSSSWFDFNPKSATLAAGRATTISVTPAAAAFAPGVYRGSIQLAFGDRTSQVVDLLLVVSSGAILSGNFTTGSDFSAATAATVCNASKLLPVFTTIAAGFNTPAAWPSSVIVQVVDDCGNTVSSGSVVVSFSNGDPPLSLLSTGAGFWSGTWVPGVTAANLIVRADATHAPLVGSVQVSGQIAKNAGVPVVTPGGVVSTGDFVTGPALGLTIAIFGSGLADAPVQPQTLPLPRQVGSTTVLLGSETLPLLYASDGLIAAVIPYDVPVNASQQLVVTHGNAVSVPVSIGMFDAAPVVLATSGAGTGQAHAYKYDAQGNAMLANAANPATAGDPLVIYAIGLGAVSPSINAGDASPSSPPSTIPATVTVQIGGVPAKVAFAGLTPTTVGLYQVNVTVPAGIAAGPQVPLTISVGAKASSGNTFIGIR